jgi:hypothetical protein
MPYAEKICGIYQIVTPKGNRLIAVSATGEIKEFMSIKAGALQMRPAKWRTASSQIIKVCTGVKKSAYGFSWAYAR